MPTTSASGLTVTTYTICLLYRDGSAWEGLGPFRSNCGPHTLGNGALTICGDAELISASLRPHPTASSALPWGTH